MFGNPIANDKKWKTSPLKEVAPESCSNHTLTTNVWLLNLDMIESNSGNVIKKIRQDYSTMLSVSAFDEGNVLFSKLRPYLNKVVIPDESGYATTELVPLRPNTEKLNKYFLGFLLRSDSFVRWANKIATGTKMPRMPLKELRNFRCILPPIALQNQFVLFTEQADKSKFGGFKSQFIEMFGNPLTNNKKWGIYTNIEDYAEIVLGSTPSTKCPEYWDGEYCWITPAELTDSSFYINETVKHITDKGARSAKLSILPKGTVLFSTRAPIGKVAITTKDMYCNQGFKNFICSDELNNVFLYYTLKYNKEQLQNMGTGTTFKELSKKVVSSLKISVPPKELQKRFENIYVQADKSKSSVHLALRTIKNTYKKYDTNS